MPITSTGLNNNFAGEMIFTKRKLTREDKLWLRFIKAPTFIAGDYGAYIVEDVDKNIAFVCLGGQGFMTEQGEYISDIQEEWLLIWNNHFVKISLYHTETAIDNKKVEMLFSIKKIICENSLMENGGEIVQIIKEALMVYGVDDPGVEVADIHFLKIAKPIYVTDVH